MLPGVAPTNRRVEVALVAIVRFRDGKLAHEHIYWDQASVLKQIGLLTDPALPVFGAESAGRCAAARNRRTAGGGDLRLGFGPADDQHFGGETYAAVRGIRTERFERLALDLRQLRARNSGDLFTKTLGHLAAHRPELFQRRAGLRC